MARMVPRRCSLSVSALSPPRENSTPTRQPSDPFGLMLIPVEYVLAPAQSDRIAGQRQCPGREAAAGFRPGLGSGLISSHPEAGRYDEDGGEVVSRRLFVSGGD